MANYYVSPTGNDSNPGTISSPLYNNILQQIQTLSASATGNEIYNNVLYNIGENKW